MEYEKFLYKFHHLDGILLRDKKKSFHKLLLSVEPSNQHLIDDIIKNLCPNTYLEESFKIDLLIHFKRSVELLNCIVSGEEIGAYKIIRQDWFIRELIQKYNPDQFVQELIPQFSLSVRSKLYKRVLVCIKDECLIDQLFEKVTQAYGLNVACILLTGCSKQQIKNVLEKENLRLSATQMKSLFDKDQSLIVDYFNVLQDKTRIDNYKWGSFFDYMGIKNPTFYVEIADKFGLHKRKLGRKSTKKFVQAEKQKILDKPSEYRYLRKDAFVRKLGQDFPLFFKNALPEHVKGFYYCYAKTFLKYYSKHKQYELYLNAFQEKYNKSLWDHVDYMDERLIEFISDKEEQDRWIAKIDNRTNIKKYVMKRKCRMQSAIIFSEEDRPRVKERKTIFNTLISTCKLTKDYDALLNILKTFCERHRNSDVTILYNFLRTVHKELDMKELTEEHWKYIYEIIAIQLFQKQQIFIPIYVEYIKFLFMNQKPTEHHVLAMLNELPSSLSNFQYGDDKFENYMLQLYVKLLPDIKDERKILTIPIALSVKKWNTKHPQNTIPISDQTQIVEVLSKLKDAENVDGDTMNIFKYFIYLQSNEEEESEWDKIYWSNFKNLNNKSITKWYLKYKPEIFKKNLDYVGIILKDKNTSLINTLKKYDHINIPNAINDLCWKELETAEPSKRSRVIQILMYFIKSEDLSIFLEKHIPQVSKVDIDSADQNTQKTFEIQCALAKYLKLSTNLNKYLPVLLKYCIGNILASALPSLYSSFCRIPENQLNYALEELSAKAVSVRKHSIFLSCLILPVERILAKYNQVQTSEKNASVRQHMFMSCYKYFLKNNTSECWPSLENYLTQLNKGQKNILKLLVAVNLIPKTYRSTFTELAWHILDKFKKENTKIDFKMGCLLQNLTLEDVKCLKHEFCMDIIENKLFDMDECSLHDNVFDFTRQFITTGEQTEKKIYSLFLVIHNFKEKFWKDNKHKRQALVLMNKFCFQLFDISNRTRVKFDKAALGLFRDAWITEFAIEETYEEIFFLNFLISHLDDDIENSSLTEEMSKAFSDAIDKYGSLIIPSFQNFLKSYLQLIFKGDDADLKFIKFLDSFLEVNSSDAHCSLVIDLLPQEYFAEGVEDIFIKIVAKLLEKDDVIKIRLFGRIKYS